MTNVTKSFRINSVASFNSEGKVVSGGAIRGLTIEVVATKGLVATGLLAKVAEMFPTARLVSYDLAVLVYCNPERSEPDFVVRPA